MLRNIISKEMLRFNVHILIFKYSRSDECNQTTRSNSLVVYCPPIGTPSRRLFPQYAKPTHNLFISECRVHYVS